MVKDSPKNVSFNSTMRENKGVLSQECEEKSGVLYNVDDI